jgi:hypothetical protein
MGVFSNWKDILAPGTFYVGDSHQRTSLRHTGETYQELIFTDPFFQKEIWPMMGSDDRAT